MKKKVPKYIIGVDWMDKYGLDCRSNMEVFDSLVSAYKFTKNDMPNLYDYKFYLLKSNKRFFYEDGELTYKDCSDTFNILQVL